MTRAEFCGGCSNQVDPRTALRWVRPGGAVAWFCSEECRIVGRDIEPSADWASDPSVFVGRHGCAVPPMKTPAPKKSAAAKKSAAPKKAAKAARRSCCGKAKARATS